MRTTPAARKRADLRIELLTSPGCPNADASRTLVNECLATLGIQAPTIDRVGRYPVADRACRWYKRHAGRDRRANRRRVPTGLAHTATRSRRIAPRRSAAVINARAVVGQTASVAEVADQLPAAIREIHQGVLRVFCDKGQAHRDDLSSTATAVGVDLDDALNQLASADLVHTASDGQVDVAYPFSGRPTGHTVRLADHRSVAAMCAIDALGIPLMTGGDGIIDSTDPDSGTLIRIQRRGHE